MDCSLPRSSVHGIFQARVVKWVAISFSRGSSQPKDRTWVSRMIGRRFPIWATREDITLWLISNYYLAYHFLISSFFSYYLYISWGREYTAAKSLQLCPTLCDPMDCSLPRSSVHGIFQARVLEWVTTSFSRGSSQPKDRTWVSRIVGRRFPIWATRLLGEILITSDMQMTPPLWQTAKRN